MEMGMAMMALWQGLEADSISAGNTRLLMIFIGIVALSMLSQAILFAFMALGAKRTQTRVLVIAEELRARALPIIDTAEDLIQDTVPKVKTITANLLETSHIVRAKATEFDATLTDANRRAKAQIERVDGMVATALTATGAIAEMIHEGVRKPVLEVSGLVNGLKAGLNVLLSKSKSFGSFGRRNGEF
jgi:hypothetical protein